MQYVCNVLYVLYVCTMEVLYMHACTVIMYCTVLYCTVLYSYVLYVCAVCFGMNVWTVCMYCTLVCVLYISEWEREKEAETIEREERTRERDR